MAEDYALLSFESGATYEKYAVYQVHYTDDLMDLIRIETEPSATDLATIASICAAQESLSKTEITSTRVAPKKDLLTLLVGGATEMTIEVEIGQAPHFIAAPQEMAGVIAGADAYTAMWRDMLADLDEADCEGNFFFELEDGAYLLLSTEQDSYYIVSALPNDAFVELIYQNGFYGAVI